MDNSQMFDEPVLSCSAVLSRSLERQKIAYLNMFDILNKLFMLDICKRNISYK